MDFPFESKHAAAERQQQEASQAAQHRATANPEEARAQALFGGTIQPPKQAPRPQSLLGNPDEALAEKLLGATTATTRPEGSTEKTDINDEDSLYRKLYDPQLSLKESLPDRILDDVLMEPEQREAALQELAEYRQMAHELSVPAETVETLRDLHPQFEHATEGQVADWAEESSSWLVQTYGAAEAGRVIQQTRAYVNSQPGLREFLDYGGRGSHPKVVQAVVELARRARK